MTFITQAALVLMTLAALLLLLLQTRWLRHARRDAAAARQALLDMETAYDQAPLGLTVLDRELRYVRINRMLADINGIPAADHLGKTIYEVVPGLAGVAGPLFEQVLRTGEPIVGLEFEGTTAAQPAVPRAFCESVYPVRGAQGEIVGVAVAAEDVTERKRLLDALHTSEQRERLRASELESVMNATPAAVFIAHDRACLNVTANDEAMRLMRMPRDASPSLSVPGPRPFRVYAEGVELTPEQLPLQVAAATGQEVRGAELEARFGNGDVLHVLMNAIPLRGHDGQVIGSAAAFVDITAQRHARQELELQARHKDEFLAVLAHELRNPLAAIQSGLELVKMEAAGGTRLATTRDIMQRQMAHVVRLIDDLLDVARISSGKLELNTGTVGVREIVEAAIELCRVDIERAGHQFHVEIPAEPLYVHADRVRLTEVICNLLHNAAKYTPDTGEIRLNVAAEQGQAVVSVSDNGIGIAPESLSHMFIMFGQAEGARAQRQGGLGVGLALANRIVELHGGAITAASDGPGTGSTFSVHLPLVSAPPSRAPACLQADARGQPLRILVLDDNCDAARTLGAMLEACGHVVRLAFSGTETLEALEHFDAQVAFLDIGLPDISGYEVARRIRARQGSQRLLLVALSGWGSDGDRRKSEQAGIDVHLTKPVTMETIGQVVQSWQRDGIRPLADQH